MMVYFLEIHEGFHFPCVQIVSNPFQKDHVTYSMWPIVLTVLNLPSDVRHLFSNFMLVGIIPGPSEPASLNPYLEILVDERISLTNMKVYDAYSMAT